ncbi:MAG: hypothetical protein ACR2O3_08535 [Rhizobiaceae bacterium]
MQTDAALEIAFARGIISESQANAIRLLDSEKAAPEMRLYHQEDNDDEGFRFVTGFSDIFIALGIIILLTGIVRTGLLDSVGGTFLIAILCWGLSEIVATWQRRSLPSIVSAAGFVTTISAAVFAHVGSIQPASLFREPDVVLVFTHNINWILPLLLLLSSLFYYWRFRLPFALFISALSFAATIFAGLLNILDSSQISPAIIPALVGSGLAIFCSAIFFDAQDPERKTRLSDNAFWLHLVASPLIVHSIMWQSAIWLTGSEQFSTQSLDQAAFPLSIVVLLIFLILMIIALIINRRAMLVSSLIYVTLALTYLGSTTGGYASAASFVPIILGSGILSIGIGWQALRKIIFRVLPADRVAPFLNPLI